MLSYAEGIRDAVWNKLEMIFKKYAGTKTFIQNQEIEKVVREVLHETSQAEVDYVMKNLFRLDADNNGSIDLPELGNFLLRRHCGEIALQRMHLNRQMSMGAQRRMNLKEFTILMNHAYSFLGVVVDPIGAEHIFNDADRDKDGKITYEEYFSFVQKHILKPEKAIVQEPKQIKQVNSRLRKYIWAQVRRLYDAYDKDHNQQLDFKELETILRDLMKDASNEDIEFVMMRTYHLDPNRTLTFQVFAPFFIVHAGELGLSKFARQHPNKRTLTRDEFLLVFKSSYSLLNVHKVNNRLLYRFFDKIDTNKDGQISFQQYLDWIKNFLAVLAYYGLLYYIEDDDADLPIGHDMIMTDEQLTLIKKLKFLCPFKFSSLDLARRARLRVLELLEVFDVNQNRNLEENEIIEILKKLMKSDEFDIFYVLANVFRYDKNEDGLVTYDEMADFFLEMHDGELALMRLHRTRSYERGKERLLNLNEFIFTLEDSLAYIDIVPTKNELTTLFSEIDLDKTGWISYKTYFEFLALYFGSKSEVSVETRRDNEFQAIIKKHSSMNLSPEQRFARIIMREMKFLLEDYDPFKSFDEELLRRFFREIFKLTEEEIDYVMRNLFRYGVGSGGLFMEMEIAGIFLELLFAEIALRRMHKTKKFLRWKERLINLEEFLQLVDSACYWMHNKPPRDLMVQIFKDLDTDNDGFITYEEYILFIRNFLSKRRDNSIDWKRFIDRDQPVTKDAKLYEEIWSDLRALYMHYVKGTYLQENELELLVKEVLHETTQNELEYIFWNMFRYDPNNDKNIEFEEFAPFILVHSAEIALQRFHFQQFHGKNSLTSQEFRLIFREAYHFLKTLDKSDNLLNAIFNELDTNHDGLVTYKEFMTWVVLNVSRTIR